MNKLTQSYQTIQSELSRMQGLLAEALGRALPVESFIRAALTTARRSPKILECSASSVLGALVECAQLGLSPDSTLGHAYLVPFKRRCQLIIGYRGIIRLARRSSEISYIEGRTVYERDVFSCCYGDPSVRKLTHIPTLGERGDIVAAYAICQFRDGTSVWEVVHADDVEAARLASKRRSSDDSPWIRYPAAMWRKTAVRRLEPFLPLDPIAQRGFALDEAGDRGEQEFDDGGLVVREDDGAKSNGQLDRLTATIATGAEQNEEKAGSSD